MPLVMYKPPSRSDCEMVNGDPSASKLSCGGVGLRLSSILSWMRMASLPRHLSSLASLKRSLGATLV